MFEPFNPRRVRLFKKEGLLPYISPQKKDQHIYGLIKKVLSGKIRGSWINKYNRKFLTRKRIVKDIHINVLLKWIKNFFPEIPIILVLRHPLAVAYSMEKLNWWDPDVIIRKYLDNEDIVKDFLKNKEDLINNVKDDFSKYILIWCIENIIPLRQCKNGEIYITFYENICREPVKEVRKIFNFLGISVDASVIKTITRPSQVSREDSAIKTGDDPVKVWKSRIGKNKIRKALKIIEGFGLDKIYTEAPMPNGEGINKI
jgi:hypothetical protein